MSTEYYTDPPVSYDSVLNNLPFGMVIKWTAGDSDPIPGSEGRQRVYIPGIRHILLLDQCGNTL